MSVVQHPTAQSALRIAHVEITQGIQIHDNSLPLVMGRPTVIRVFPAVPFDQRVDGVTAQLRARRKGDTAWSPWIDPDNGPIRAGWRFWRGDPQASLNFTLEPDWYSARAGSTQAKLETRFEAELVLPTSSSTSSGSRGRCTFAARFHRRRPLRLEYVCVAFVRRHQGRTIRDVPGPRVQTQQAANWLRAVYPVDPTAVEYEPCHVSELEFDGVDDDGTLDGSALILELNKIYLASPDADRLFGWTPEDSFRYHGRSDPIYLGGQATVAFGNDTGDPAKPETWRWRRTFVHEHGHNTDAYGLPHPPTDPVSAPPPHLPSRLQDDEYGFDVLPVDPLARVVMRDFDSSSVFDFMVGGKLECEAWIGRHHYIRLFKWLNPKNGAVHRRRRTRGAPDVIRLVHGIIRRDGGGQLHPFFQLPITERNRAIGDHRPRESGPVEILFFDRHRQVIDSLRLSWNPQFVDAEGNPTTSSAFSWLLPLKQVDDDRIHSVQLFSRHAPIDQSERVDSLAVQQVEVEDVDQGNGEPGQPAKKVTWQVTVDGHPPPPAVAARIGFLVFYSSDEQDWSLVATGKPGAPPAAVIPTGRLPRGAGDESGRFTGWFRIQASLGYGEATAITEVQLEAARAVPGIVVPTKEQVVYIGASMLLVGYGFIGGQRVPSEQLAWSLARQGETAHLGKGEKLVVRPGSNGYPYTSGQYTVTLAIGDATTSVPIDVKSRTGAGSIE